MTVVDIGALRHRLALEAPARVAGEAGTATVTWAPVDVVWAAIEPIKSTETPAADGVSGRVTHAIRLRWRADVTPAHRLRLGVRVFEIRGLLDEGERRRWLLCRCEEQGP